MSTRNFQSQTDAESSADTTATRTPTTAAVSRSSTARAPKTFSSKSTDHLQNLIGEYNGAISLSRSQS